MPTLFRPKLVSVIVLGLLFGCPSRTPTMSTPNEAGDACREAIYPAGPTMTPEHIARTTTISIEPRTNRLATAIPGESIAVLRRVTNNTNDAIDLGPYAEALRDVHGWIPASSAVIELVQVMEEVMPANGMLQPGSSASVCLRFVVPARRIDAGPQNRLEVGLGDRFTFPMPIFEIEYPQEYGAWPEGTWGGFIRVELEEGVSPVEIARALGLRIGTDRVLFRPEQANAGAPQLLFQVPRGQDANAAERSLRQYEGVSSAEIIHPGDPGTEGCSAYSPCQNGYTCCYTCGVAGCPNSCVRGGTCPTDIP